MTDTTRSFPGIPSDQLDAVTGGGAIASIASLFGEKGAKYGAIAEQIFGLFKGGGSSSGSSDAGAAQ